MSNSGRSNLSVSWVVLLLVVVLLLLGGVYVCVCAFSYQSTQLRIIRWHCVVAFSSHIYVTFRNWPHVARFTQYVRFTPEKLSSHWKFKISKYNVKSKNILTKKFPWASISWNRKKYIINILKLLQNMFAWFHWLFYHCDSSGRNNRGRQLKAGEHSVTCCFRTFSLIAGGL